MHARQIRRDAWASVRGIGFASHLAHLDLRKGLTTPQVRTVLDEITRELARVGRAQYRRVLLLLEQHDLVLERHADDVARLLLVTERVRLPRERGDERAVGRGGV